jgi:hypothetical protein
MIYSASLASLCFAVMLAIYSASLASLCFAVMLRWMKDIAISDVCVTTKLKKIQMPSVVLLTNV